MYENKKIYSIAIVGSGPAAYTACLYTNHLDPILFEGTIVGNNGPGGQLTTTTDVDNYPGFPKGIHGNELVENMQSQVKCKVISETVTEIVKIDYDNKHKYIFEISGEKNNYYAKCVIIATGAQARRLFVPGTCDDQYWQKGVSSCAVCDGWAYKDKVVVVIGGGDSAMEEALYLASISSKVMIVHRRDVFRARHDMLERAKKNVKIEILTPFVLEAVGRKKEFIRLYEERGVDMNFRSLQNYDDGNVDTILLRNCEDGELIMISADGLFFGIGHDPNTSFLDESLEKDENGYIVTDEACKTSYPGIFACGDVQDNKYRQAVTAAGSGCIAAISAINFLAE